MTDTEIEGISPFFVVRDVTRSIGFYRDRLGFAVAFQDPAQDPFFATLRRGGAQLFVKSQDGVAAAPNLSRHPHLRWDAYLAVPDPDALAGEFAARGVAFTMPLADTSDGLRGFELADPDGHILFFGRPR
jgi:catechol 2,3-dioxygenase-like lactoylglutathione lyase family enzyme